MRSDLSLSSRARDYLIHEVRRQDMEPNLDRLAHCLERVRIAEPEAYAVSPLVALWRARLEAWVAAAAVEVAPTAPIERGESVPLSRNADYLAWASGQPISREDGPDAEVAEHLVRAVPSGDQRSDGAPAALSASKDLGVAVGSVPFSSSAPFTLSNLLNRFRAVWDGWRRSKAGVDSTSPRVEAKTD